jgi:apolipoprotein D and lipocalin family protein
VEGQLQVVGRDGEGKISVKYTSLPVPYEAQYVILDTDYKSYAVMWSCNGIGPIHTQSAWVLTRDRLAPGLVLQMAYGVLDKFKISRAFFVRTNQEEVGEKNVQGKNAVDSPVDDHVSVFLIVDF